jgi:hypothetical protein
MVKILLAARDVETTPVVVVSKWENRNYIEQKYFLRVRSR